MINPVYLFNMKTMKPTPNSATNALANSPEGDTGHRELLNNLTVPTAC